jgi:hypothetical protein
MCSKNYSNILQKSKTNTYADDLLTQNFCKSKNIRKKSTKLNSYQYIQIKPDS